MTAEPMPPVDPMARSGARWCDTHSRWECAANVARAHHASAMVGQAYCYNHVGKTTAEARAEGRARSAAWDLQAAAELPPVNTAAGILALIHMSTRRLAIYSNELRVQYEIDGASGLVGGTWVAGRAGEGVQSGEQLRGLVKLEMEEKKFLAYLLKEAHGMRIDEQQIELAQGQAAIVSAGLRAAIEAAGPDLLPATRSRMVAAFLDIVEGRGGGPAGGSPTPELEGGGV